MNLLQKAQEYKELSEAITANVQAAKYYEQKLIIAAISLILLSLDCPDIEAAYRDGTVARISKAFENNKIDMSYSLPVVLVIGNGHNMKPINTWDELLKVLNEIER